MEQVTYNMLFRWFIGLSMEAPVWDVTVFTKNRERLLADDIAVAFLLSVMSNPAVKRLLSSEHFSIDGTLIDAWASMKSLPSARTAPTMIRPVLIATPSATSVVTSGATRPMHRLLIPMPGFIASPMANHRGPATWGTC